MAYRLTGSLADAEDAVQETWLRLAGLTETRREDIRDLRAWCTTVVGRVCLDRLRSAAARRERYVGTWLPEPIVGPLDTRATDDPMDVVVRDDAVRLAAMVVLDALPPRQRVAFVLHDAFDVPFEEIGEILSCSATAARQHASRARRTLAEADPPPRVDAGEQLELLERFTQAMLSGDIEAMVALLHPEARLVGDSNGKAKTVRRVVVGADKIARLLLGLLASYGPDFVRAARPVLVNGDPGLHLPAKSGDGRYRDLDEHVQTFAVRDGRIVALYDIVNPDKLTRVPR